MSGLSFTPDSLPSLPDKPLNSADVGVKLVGGTVGYEAEPELAGVRFSLGVEGNASIGAFNSPDDEDEDGVLGQPVEDGTLASEIVLPPQIHLEGDNAWLKFRFSAKAKGQASGTIAPVDFGIDASKEVIFADYHVHPGSANTRATVLDDIRKLRFAANVNDVFELAEKEALSYQVRGSLSASVTLSWSDVMTASLSSLSNLLKASRVLAIQISATASVKFHVDVMDNFLVVFTKGSGDKVRVAVKKADAREAGVAASVGVSVGFANEDDVAEVVNKLLESAAGEAFDTVQDILKKASSADLSDAERGIAAAVIERLGVAQAGQGVLEVLRVQWEALRGRIENAVKAAAKAKVEAGFTYEYLRIRTEDTLLVAELDREVFKQVHGDLMLCNLRRLLDLVAQGNIQLETYLNQKTLKRTQAWGFTLGVGRWKLSGKDQKELSMVSQKNKLIDRERVAYLGMRGYTADWFGDKVNWTVDFNAAMKGFAKDPVPTTCEFDYGLDFKWTWSEKKLKESELRDYLDYAVIWRILAMGNVPEVIEKVRSNLNREAEISVQLTIDNEVFRALLPLAAAASADAGPRALAKAMPFMDDFDARRSPMLRELCYAPLWKFYFENDSLPIETYPQIAANSIEKMTQLQHERELAARERGFLPGRPAYQDAYTFSGQIRLNGETVNDHSGIHANWLKFINGLKTLNDALNPERCAPHKTVEDVFKRLSAFWGQTLYVRTAGVFLLDLAASQGDLLSKINRTCSISFSGGEVFTFAASV